MILFDDCLFDSCRLVTKAPIETVSNKTRSYARIRWMQGKVIATVVLLACLTCFCTTGFSQGQSNTNKTPQNKKRQAKTSPKKTNQKQGAQNNKNAQGKSARKPSAKKPETQKPGTEITKARRNELMRFVKMHHPEIRPLLNTLRKNRPAQYEATIRQLDREVRSIQNLKSRAPKRFERALEMWIARSKTKLLSAQLALNKTDAEKRKIKKQIRGLLGRHSNLRRQQLTSDIKTIEDRLERLNSQLSTLETNRTNDIERQMKSITQNAQRISDNRKRKQTQKKKPPVKKNQPQAAKQRDQDQ